MIVALSPTAYRRFLRKMNRPGKPTHSIIQGAEQLRRLYAMQVKAEGIRALRARLSTERGDSEKSPALSPTETEGAGPSDEVVEAVARAIRKGRACTEDVRCGFCEWGPDELTASMDETGCIWLARAAIEAHQKATGGDPRGEATAIPSPGT